MKHFDYKGFRIEYTISQVGHPHLQEGKYISDEYLIGVFHEGGYSIKRFSHDPLFFKTQEEAEANILTRAKLTIEDQFL